MSKKILITILIILLSGLIVLSGVYANNFFKNSQEKFPPFNFKKLNLTDEQKEKIEKILKEFKDKSEEILKKVKENIEKEKVLLSKEVLNEKDLDFLVESQIKNLIDLSDLRKDAYLNIISILNKEQIKIFPTFVEFSIIKTKGFMPDFIKEKLENFNQKIKDYIKVGRRLNLSEEQRKNLKELIKEENSKKLKLMYYFELQFLKKRLNLTDEQTEKIKNLFKDEKEKERVFLEKIKENNQKQKETLKSENFNKKSLTTLINEYILLEREVLSLRKSLYLDFVKILTSDQRKNSPTSIFFFKIK